MTEKETTQISGTITFLKGDSAKKAAELFQKKKDKDEAQSECIVDNTFIWDEVEDTAISRFVEARQNGKMEEVRDLFDPEVTLVVYDRETLHGIDAVLGFWQERYNASLTRHVKSNYRLLSCRLYIGTILEEVPEQFERMLINFRFRDEKIVGMCFAPEYPNLEFPGHGGFMEQSYLETFFQQFYTSSIKPKKNRIPCQHCGEFSENLEWHTFHVVTYDRLYGYRGIVSVCPNCHRTVEIRPEKKEDMTKETLRKKEAPEEPSRRVPAVITSYFEYALPLAGSKLTETLDDIRLINLEVPLAGPEGEPRTVKKCAEEFHPILLRQFASQDPETINAIVDCYHKAFLLGDVEAGNNLGILYLNYQGRYDEGMEVLRACVERGNANAIANYFIGLWEMKGDRAGAVAFALSAPAKPSPLCWNLAVMYLRGPAIEGNPLPINKEKAKEYLRMVVDATALPVSDADETARWREMARRLLPLVDGYNEFSETARDYVHIAIPRCVKYARRWYDDVTIEECLFGEFSHISIPQDKSLLLKTKTPLNISEFLLIDKNRNIDAIGEKILFRLNVEKSVYGAWEAYLVSKTQNLLPTHEKNKDIEWTLLFGIEEFNQIMAQQGRCRELICRDDDFRPRVILKGDTATVECYIWSKWGGLLRETVKIVFDGNTIWTLNRSLRSYDYTNRFRKA